MSVKANICDKPRGMLSSKPVENKCHWRCPGFLDYINKVAWCSLNFSLPSSKPGLNHSPRQFLPVYLPTLVASDWCTRSHDCVHSLMHPAGKVGTNLGAFPWDLRLGCPLNSIWLISWGSGRVLANIHACDHFPFVEYSRCVHYAR